MGKLRATGEQATSLVGWVRRSGFLAFLPASQAPAIESVELLLSGKISWVGLRSAQARNRTHPNQRASYLEACLMLLCSTASLLRPSFSPPLHKLRDGILLRTE